MLEKASHPETNADAEPINALENLIGYQLRRASSKLMADLARALDRHGLTPSDASILVLVRDNPEITQSEIGRLLGIKRANMTPLSASLENRGLILRRRMDGRSQGLILTEKGTEICAAAYQAIVNHDRRYFGYLEIEERARFYSTINRLWE